MKNRRVLSLLAFFGLVLLTTVSSEDSESVSQLTPSKKVITKTFHDLPDEDDEWIPPRPTRKVVLTKTSDGSVRLIRPIKTNVLIEMDYEDDEFKTPTIEETNFHKRLYQVRIF